MLIHRNNCTYNYGTTDEVFELEDITGVFGPRNVRWFRVKSVGHEKEDWERKFLLVRNGCIDSIRNFWTRSGLDPLRRPHRQVQVHGMRKDILESSRPQNTQNQSD